jgi:two-component sensor histidine kinase
VFTFADQIDARVEIARDGGTTFRFTFASEQRGS